VEGNLAAGTDVASLGHDRTAQVASYRWCRDRRADLHRELLFRYRDQSRCSTETAIFR